MKKFVIIAWVLLVVAFIGFLDASYLTIEHYKGEVPPCTLIGGCEAVTTSSYAKIMGVPVALLGSIYYFTMMILSMLYIQHERAQLLQILRYVSLIGFLASVYFVYLQIGIIDSICEYCMLSAITSTTLCFVSWFGFRKSAAPTI